ncbi:MAG TPA: hypothetical protein VFP50_19195 [Anaeromyxobacteraceae bacterium]|nr:hypothetical protein [Anaeromyxobacteraceae bacterium]
MKHDAVFRLRMPKREIAALKRVARERGQAASDYVRRLVAEHVRRDEAAQQVRELLRAAPAAALTDDEALALADEAKHATRR